jgi:4,5-dihydroxyphthalate decarboxylase
MLVAGELDAAVLTGASLEDPRVRPVITHPDAAAKTWYQRYGTVPINHMVVVRESLLKSSPWLAQEVFRLLADSRKAAGPSKDGLDPFPLGVEAARKSLELIVKYSAQQGLIPRQYGVNELFTDQTRGLRV